MREAQSVLLLILLLMTAAIAGADDYYAIYLNDLKRKLNAIDREIFGRIDDDLQIHLTTFGSDSTTNRFVDLSGGKSVRRRRKIINDSLHLNALLSKLELILINYLLDTHHNYDHFYYNLDYLMNDPMREEMRELFRFKSSIDPLPDKRFTQLVHQLNRWKKSSSSSSLDHLKSFLSL